MKSKVVAIAVIFSMLSCGTASAQWPDNTYGNRTQWEVEVGTRILERPSTDLAFSLVTSSPTDVTVFDAADASELGASAGADFRFSRKNGGGSTWEVRGFFNNWNNFESEVGTLEAPLFTPAALPVGTVLSAFDYEYDSNLFGVEWNFKRTIRPGLSVFAGPRYLDLSEQTDIGSTFTNPLIPGFLLNVDSVTQTSNHMPGLGFGVEIKRPISRELFFVANAKGAILANFVSTSTVATTTLAGFPVAPAATVFDDSETQAAGIGEFSVRVHYDIAPGTLSAYFGYEAFWLDGAALAPAQLLSALSPPIEVNTSTTTFAQGLVLGLSARF